MDYRPDLLSPDDIRQLQTELTKTGYYKGEVDGKWGPQSDAAFRLWRASQERRIVVSTETELTPAVVAEFEKLFSAATIPSLHADQVQAVAHRLLAGRSRYEAVASSTGVPWHVIGLIHGRECDFSFAQHLHNGDPLAARTVHVPAGRPVTGHAPFEWAYSAADALYCDRFTTWQDWSVAGTLHKLEGYNGFGYRTRGLPTPYLWNMTSLEQPGKFVADGKFDPNAEDKEAGCVAVLLALMRAGAVAL